MKSVVLTLLSLLAAQYSTMAQRIAPQFFQLCVYHFSDKSQEQLIDDYLANAWLPALHLQKIPAIGVFKPIANDTAADKRIYLLVPLQTADQYGTLLKNAEKTPAYLAAAAAYRNAPFNQAPYQRIEQILLKAFSLAPRLSIPRLKSSPETRVYELRSYESATETLHQNKVEMFNEGGEIALFRRLGFNAVFYGSVIAGSRMPNLMYMTCFENMEQRTQHWKAFTDDPAWKALSPQARYQNNVSHIDIVLAHAAGYSDY